MHGEEESFRASPLVVQKCEKALMRSVRVFASEGFLDSVTLARSILEDPNDFFQCLEVFSANKAFLVSPESRRGRKGVRRSKHNSTAGEYSDLLPERFNVARGGTIQQWLCGFFEETLISRYCDANEDKVEECKRPLKEYREMERFWREASSGEKVKVVFLESVDT